MWGQIFVGQWGPEDLKGGYWCFVSFEKVARRQFPLGSWRRSKEIPFETERKQMCFQSDVVAYVFFSLSSKYTHTWHTSKFDLIGSISRIWLCYIVCCAHSVRRRVSNDLWSSIIPTYTLCTSIQNDLFDSDCLMLKFLFSWCLKNFIDILLFENYSIKIKLLKVQKYGGKNLNFHLFIKGSIKVSNICKIKMIEGKFNLPLDCIDRVILKLQTYIILFTQVSQ